MQSINIRINALSVLLLLVPTIMLPLVAGPPVIGTYSLNASPPFAQEGSTITLVLTVSGFTSSTSITFSFRFNVRNPAGTTSQSKTMNYTTVPGQTEFTILVNYPSSALPGTNSLAGTYTAWVDELAPFSSTMVATTSFVLTLTDSSSYERTQTVNMRATGYNASESVTVQIRTQATSTLVFSRTISASSGGLVSATWPIPVNATIDTYSVTLTGTSTFKAPADSQKFNVRQATMAIPAITSSQASYQRTQTLSFSFQPRYPDGSLASSGVALLTLTRPDTANTTLAATYNSTTQAFTANYLTSTDNQTGTWTASLSGHAYSDPYGNTGPGATVTSSPQLNQASLSVTVTTSNTIFSIGQMIRFNATISYPDGTRVQSGPVGAYLLYSGNQQTINDSVSILYDTGLTVWVGTYTPKASDIGGLWSLVVKASDSASPPNSGSATRAITIQNGSSPSSDNSLPLYYYGLLAALIAGLLIVGFLAFRRRKVTHARLKIDLEAVQSEASKIQDQEFFQSVKDQLKQKKEGKSGQSPD